MYREERATQCGHVKCGAHDSLSNVSPCARHLSSVGRRDAEHVAQCRDGRLQIELRRLGEVGLRKGSRRGREKEGKRV